MEQSYVARATALMMQGARKSALVIVPLAAAVSAHGVAVSLATTPVYCDYVAFSTNTLRRFSANRQHGRSRRPGY